MLDVAMLYLGALLTMVWGIAHLFPTRNVVKGFGAISADNQRIITMEWIIEGVSLIFIGVLAAAITFIDPQAVVSKAVYGIIVVELLVLTIVSLLTGFKVNFLPFKLCPAIFTVSAVLVLVGGLL